MKATIHLINHNDLVETYIRGFNETADTDPTFTIDITEHINTRVNAGINDVLTRLTTANQLDTKRRQGYDAPETEQHGNSYQRPLHDEASGKVETVPTAEADFKRSNEDAPKVKNNHDGAPSRSSKRP